MVHDDKTELDLVREAHEALCELAHRMGAQDLCCAPTSTPTPAPTPTQPIHLSPPAPVTLTSEQIEAWTWPAVSQHKAASLNDQAAFRFFGNWTGELNYDDVLLHPGRPGAAHLHIYSGLPGVNAHSTLDSMLAYEGETYWVGNRTMRPAVWHPAAIIGDQVKIHDFVEVYYKQDARKEFLPALPHDIAYEDLRAIWRERGPQVAARDGLDYSIEDDRKEADKRALTEYAREYHAEHGTIYGPENIPQGLCMIAGHRMDGAPGHCHYRLYVPGRGEIKGPTIAAALAKWGGGDTPAGTTLTEAIGFLPHWNGDLGSADYRSHLASEEFGARTLYLRMPPASHPRTTISVTVFRKWSQREGEPPLSQMRLSSDHPDMEAGATGHCDYISLWPQWTKDAWYQNIIVPHLSASSSGNTINYGNGRGASNPKHSLSGWEGHPRFVPVPMNHHGHDHHAM